jgi:hypothetical protein
VKVQCFLRFRVSEIRYQKSDMRGNVTNETQFPTSRFLTSDFRQSPAERALDVGFHPAFAGRRLRPGDPHARWTFFHRLDVEALPRRKSFAAAQNFDRAAAIRSAICGGLATLASGDDFGLGQEANPGRFVRHA